VRKARPTAVPGMWPEAAAVWMHAEAEAIVWEQAASG
jgi:hypothetical protein